MLDQHWVIEIGPTMSWSILPDFAKWICSALMLVGRFRDIYRACYSYSRVLEEDLKASPYHLF